MSELITAPAEPLEVVNDPGHISEAPSQPPVVITEQQVMFSTAAAAPLPLTRPTRSVIAVLRAMFLNSPGGAGLGPRHIPPRRDVFLEQAAMAREMRRL